MKTITIRNKELVAVNRTASRVTRKNEGYKPTFQHNREIFDAPPLCSPVPKNKINLIGTKRGNMVVHSYMGDDKWLAKCICGKYEIRNGESWRRGLREHKRDDGCVYCQQQLRRNGLIS